MKTLFNLFLLGILLVGSGSVHASLSYYEEFPDIVRVTSKPPVANFEVYSLSLTRDAIEQTRSRISSSIAAQAQRNSSIARNTKLPLDDAS